MKFAQRMKTTVEELRYDSLYTFADQWWQVPYLRQGASKEGISNIRFIKHLYENVYDVKLPLTIAELQQLKEAHYFKKREYLEEGDLLFFSLQVAGKISHVGVMLVNGHFLHASLYQGDQKPRGVKINSLDEPYWKKRFRKAARIKL